MLKMDENNDGKNFFIRRQYFLKLQGFEKAPESF